MSSDKINKTNVWKNIVGFGALALTIFCIFIFPISIHFTIFENIDFMSFNSLIFTYFLGFLVVIIIVFVIVIVILYIKRKNIKEIDK